MVTDEELVSCSLQIGRGADLSILAAHLGIPGSNATNTPKNIGRDFEKASRL